MKFFLLQKAGLILKKGAFFEIFKPIIWAQLCAYGNWPSTYQKSTDFFLDPQLKRFSGNKPHKLT